MAGMGEAIVLGLGNNIDYEIYLDSAIMEEMIRENGVFSRDIDRPGPIHTPRDLLISILGFMRQGSGGEQQVANTTIIERYAEQFPTKTTLGGTSVRAAIVMAKLGYNSAVHLVTMNEYVTRLLPPDCGRLCSNPETSSYPHLIAQYRAGISINANDIHIETSRANRIIYTFDPDNERMILHPGLGDMLTGGRVFLISGFNAMHDPSLLEARLRQLQGFMQSLPPEALVFYEDAGFHCPGMQPIIWRYLLDCIAIYSLNEDELQGYLERAVNLTNAAEVARALEDMHKLIPVPVLALHTRYWALAYGDGAARYRKALTGGIAMATSRFRLGDDFTRQDYEETGRLPPEAEGAAFAAEIQAMPGGRVCCAPALQVTETKVTTVGLGDSFVGGFLPALL
jgi:ADP-dependent phosphofructokinase/glucokinase